MRSACRLILVNIYMKFHENILNCFKVTERTQSCLRNCYLQSSKGHNSKRTNTRVMVLAFCMFVNICMKFQEYILNGFQVTGRKRFCDRQTDGWKDRWTDRWTDDPGKNNTSPNPNGRRHNYTDWHKQNSPSYFQNSFPKDLWKWKT